MPFFRTVVTDTTQPRCSPNRPVRRLKMTLHRQFKITPLALEKMKTHLAGSYPREGCGILAGDDTGSIEEVFCVTNGSSKERASGHYEIDPLVMYELEKKAEEKGYEILGFYHSHPDRPPMMSREDSEHMIPHMLYVIASVARGRCCEIRGYIKD